MRALTRMTSFFARLTCLALLMTTPCRAADNVTLITPDLVALSQLPQVTLPPAPTYVLNTSELWSLDDIAAQFGIVTDRIPPINSTRTFFVRPDHRWLIAFNRWFMHLKKELKLDYKDGVWDCDDFARCFVSFADMIALGAGESRGSICVGWATVANVNAFGSVAASSIGAHAIVIVGTSDGLFVIEPQTGKMAALRDYPNQNYFSVVYL